MSVSIGFVLQTHEKPPDAIRLVNRLNSMFDYPPIAWHHDFSKSDFPSSFMTENVFPVLPHVVTGRGKFSILDASLAALELLYSKSSPDWWMNISGADYPIKPASTIINDLSNSLFDVHIHHEKIVYNSYERIWQKWCYDRYCSRKLFSIPVIKHSGGFRSRTMIRVRLAKKIVQLRNPIFATSDNPFTDSGFHCYAGEHWLTANKKAAEYLVQYHKSKPALANYYRKQDKYGIFSDESYYQTVFCNSPLKISPNHWRYIKWISGRASPETIVMEDFLKMRESAAHFARKFNPDIDQEILDALDEYTSG